jgi:hypothetical protein
MSDDRFRGEEKREIGFRDELQRRYPKLTLIDASGGHGLEVQTDERVRRAVGTERMLSWRIEGPTDADVGVSTAPGQQLGARFNAWHRFTVTAQNPSAFRPKARCPL